MEDDEQSHDELDAPRAELAEWRRRAEMAEAIAAERLARAETAEQALRAAETALRALERAAPAPRPTASPATAPAEGSGTEQAAEPVPEETAPRSLREWWRRYTDSLT